MKNKYSLKFFMSCALMLIPALVVLILRLATDKDIALLPVITISVMLLVLQLFMVVIEKKNIRTQNAKITNLIYFILPVLNLFICGIGVFAMSGIEFGLSRIVGIFMGASFICFGNYLPKCTRNRTVGIKVRWALENDENWRATHRFGGIVWCIAGLLTCSTAFLPEKLFIAVFLALILLAAIVPTVYSYIYYRRQVREGTYVKVENSQTTLSPKAKKLTVFAVVILLVLVAVMLFTGDVTVSLGEDHVTAKSTFWSKSEIAYDDIETVDYLESVGSDVREFGVGSPRLLVGRFRNSEIGAYVRYTYTKCNSAVLIVTKDGNAYMLGCETEDETAKLYGELEERLSQEASK